MGDRQGQWVAEVAEKAETVTVGRDAAADYVIPAELGTLRRDGLTAVDVAAGSELAEFSAVPGPQASAAGEFPAANGLVGTDKLHQDWKLFGGNSEQEFKILSVAQGVFHWRLAATI